MLKLTAVNNHRAYLYDPGKTQHSTYSVWRLCHSLSGLQYQPVVYSLHTERGFSQREFRLTMTRGDIGNYLGLTVETISRLLGRFQKSGMLAVKGKYITIENHALLAELAGQTEQAA